MILRSVLEGITMNLSIVLDVLRQQVDVEEILVIGSELGCSLEADNG